MKNYLGVASLTLLTLIISCSKESESETVSDEGAANLEQRELAANVVSDNVQINGSTKEQGEPPTPNGKIEFDLSQTSKNAFLLDGFDITLTSEDNIVGAYLRFTSENGDAATSYYSIDLDENNNQYAKGKQKLRFTNAPTRNTNKTEDETYFDIDFNENIEPGLICYEICVYDANGNISAPQQACLTVQSWGGYNEAVGTWKISEMYRIGHPGVVFKNNVEACHTKVVSRSCLSSYSFEFNSTSCLTVNFEIVMNADGTYSEKYVDNGGYELTSLVNAPDGFTEDDLNSLAQQCGIELNAKNKELIYKGRGYWTYLQDSGNIVFYEAESSETLDGESTRESDYLPGLYYGSGDYENGISRIEEGKLKILGFEFQNFIFEK